MSLRLSPILINESKELDWKVNKKKSSLENINTLIKKILKEVDSIKAQKISISKEKQKRKNLEKALDKMGINLETIFALAEVCSKSNVLSLDQTLQKKETHDLNREFLFLVRNIENIRKKSSEYQEAWREIEAEYFLKVSLYNTELQRRTT
jgi:hypothetical protein